MAGSRAARGPAAGRGWNEPLRLGSARRKSARDPGAFYADEGPRGPVVNPGSYLVRLSTRSGVQSVPLEVVLDPRLKDTVSAPDMAAHWDLATRTTQDIDALHRAVNQIRTMRRN